MLETILATGLLIDVQAFYATVVLFVNEAIDEDEAFKVNSFNVNDTSLSLISF